MIGQDGSREHVAWLSLSDRSVGDEVTIRIIDSEMPDTTVKRTTPEGEKGELERLKAESAAAIRRFRRKESPQPPSGGRHEHGHQGAAFLPCGTRVVGS